MVRFSRAKRPVALPCESAMVTTAASAAVFNRPCHAEAIRQFFSHGQELLVRAKAHVLVLDVLESIQELLLIVLGQGLVGHREQAMVLLLDVFAQKADITSGMTHELTDRVAFTGGGSLDRLGHATDMIPALLMFVEHHARRTALARKALGLHRR